MAKDRKKIDWEQAQRDANKLSDAAKSSIPKIEPVDPITPDEASAWPDAGPTAIQGLDPIIADAGNGSPLNVTPQVQQGATPTPSDSPEQFPATNPFSGEPLATPPMRAVEPTQPEQPTRGIAEPQNTVENTERAEPRSAQQARPEIRVSDTRGVAGDSPGGGESRVADLLTALVAGQDEMNRNIERILQLMEERDG